MFRGKTFRATVKRPFQSRGFFWSSSNAIPPIAPETLASQFQPLVSIDLVPAVFASILASQDSEEELLPPWKIVDLSAKGKGYGTLASRNIERGEKLVSERPICIWPNVLSPEQAKELFDEMGEPSQKILMDLANSVPNVGNGVGEQVLARRATNGFAIPLPVTTVGGPKSVTMVFPNIARVNHSCLPNASQVVDFASLKMEVYSLSPISRDTEISIEYLPGLITQTRAERQDSLRRSFGMPVCKCELCSLPEDQIAASDIRRKEIKSLGENLRSGTREQKLQQLERVRELLALEGYKGLPEWDDSNVTRVYAIFATMKARSDKEVQ